LITLCERANQLKKNLDFEFIKNLKPKPRSRPVRSINISESDKTKQSSKTGDKTDRSMNDKDSLAVIEETTEEALKREHAQRLAFTKRRCQTTA
jgi:hypothetical protein